MKQLLAVVLIAFGLGVFPSSGEASSPITRREGFLLIWSSIERPSHPSSEQFSDLKEGQKGYGEISYALSRGVIDESETFRPDAPLDLESALLWLFRTRNLEGKDWKTMVESRDFPSILLRYPIARDLPEASLRMTYLTEEDLLSLMRNLDRMLATETHEVSLYAEDFHGESTAFGETFDMNAFTAAHKTYPFNTLVRVTNIANGKSIVVRINDRGPFVPGRDMDLSLASFEAIADRAQGKIRATFQRLGDMSIVGTCTRQSIYQTRLVPGTRLLPGIPHALAIGRTLVLRSDRSFVVRSVTYPDGFRSWVEDWVLPGETYTFKPSVTGAYTFTIGSSDRRARAMTMQVAQCSQ